MYKIGRVYKIECLVENIVYVGSTFCTLRRRMRSHGYKRMSTITKFIEKYGKENFTISLIKKYLVVDKFHLRAYEQLWINKLDCVNKFEAIGYTRGIKWIRKIYDRQKKIQYRQEHKEKITARHRLYRQENKEKETARNKLYYQRKKQEINAYNKNYYQENKERLKEYARQQRLLKKNK